MSEKLTPSNEGYQPVHKGYQPVESTPTGTSDTGDVQGGYQPTTSEGGSPATPPPNKK